MGWEIYGHCLSREEAIVESLNLIQNIESEGYEENYQIVFENRSESFSFEPTYPIKQVIEHCILRFGQEEFSGREWELISNIGIGMNENHHIAIYRQYQPFTLNYVGNI